MYEGENDIDYGYHNVLFLIQPDSATTIMGSADIYVSDFAGISFSAMGETEPEPAKYTYPASFVCPKSFAKDYNCYSTNDDGTLTLVAHDPAGISDAGEELIVPETVYGKTVTAIADYAFCPEPFASGNPVSITVPAAVTSIGKKAFGYSYFEKESNDTIDSDLLELIADAADTDTFKIYISIYSNDADDIEVYSHIMSTYFPEITENIYDETDESVTLTATKAQIMAMKDESNIQISSATEPEDPYPSLSYLLTDLIETMPSDTVVPVCVSIGLDAPSLIPSLQYKTLAKQFMNTYMNGSTDYRLDANYGEIHFNATLNQIVGMANCDYAFITLDYPANLDSELFAYLYSMSDTDTINIQVYNESSEDNETFFKTFREKYFPDNKFENNFNDEQNSINIFDVTKAQILAVPQAEEVTIYKYNPDDGEPLQIENFIVYGYSGSVANKFALENSLKFVDISGNYKKGDANLDGKVSIADATEIQKYGIDKVTFNDTQLKLSDVNNDSRVNIMDATTIQKYLIGKVEI